MLEQHAAAPLHSLPLARRQGVEVLPEDLDLPGSLVHQSENGAHEHGFTGARAAHKAQHLAALHIEIKAPQDQARPESQIKAAHPDGDIGWGAGLSAEGAGRIAHVSI